MRDLQCAEAPAFERRFSRISGCRGNMTFLSENEACNLLRYCFDAAQRYTFALQHTAKHRHCRMAPGIFFVEARRNVGKALELAIARRVHRTGVAGEYGPPWRFWRCGDVELFRTNAPNAT